MLSQGGEEESCKAEGEKPKWADVVAGVQQGSVLCPLLFICYFNDLIDIIHANVNIFVDHTQLIANVSLGGNIIDKQNDIARLLELATIKNHHG